MGGLVLLSAGLLGGLVVTLLPTLIHLLSRRRARRVRFAPMELLLRSQKRTARSIRLRQLLLLLLRTLFVAAIAAALLRPLWLKQEEQRQTQAPAAVVVVLDASASMNASLDGRTALARAKSKAKDALAALVDDVRTGLVVCEARPREAVLLTFDRAAVVAAIDAVEAGWAFADVAACIDRAASLADGVRDERGQAVTGERRVVVVSDLAAHGFENDAGSATDGAALHIEMVSAFDEENPPNHGIVDLDDGFSAQGQQVRFHAVRFGGPDVEVAADLLVDGKRATRLALPFQNGKLLERVFTALPIDALDAAPAAALRGEHTLGVALGDDALAGDNSVDLPIEERDAVRVLVVDGEPDALPLADEIFYLSQALSSSRAGASGKSRLVVRSLTADRMDAAALVDTDVVILANVARLEPAAAAALTTHIEAGAGLLVTMGDQVDVDAWNRDLARLLPAALRGVKGQALLDDASVADVLGLARLDVEHPVLRAIAGADSGALTGLTRVRTTTTMLVEPNAGAQQPGAQRILARFTNDAPALIERAVGPVDGNVDGAAAGRVLLLTTSIDREWTDLPIRPGFLPLVEQMVLYLGRALDDGRPRTVRVFDDRAILAAGAEAVVVVTPARGEVRLDVKDGVAHYSPDAPGLYRPFAVRGGDRTLLSVERFSALIDPREIDLRRVDDDRARAVVPRGAVVRRGSDDEPGTPLWPALLLFGAFLLLAEGALLRRSGSA